MSTWNFSKVANTNLPEENNIPVYPKTDKNKNVIK